MAKPPYQPKPREVSLAIHEVVYEYVSMEAAHRLLQEQHKKTINISLLNDFLMHCRVLMEFLLSIPYKDNVLAEHFCNGSYVRPTLAVCGRRKTDLNTLLAHLTYERVKTRRRRTGFRGAPDQDALYSELRDAWDDFLSQLSSKVRRRFKRKLTATRKGFQSARRRA